MYTKDKNTRIQFRISDYELEKLKILAYNNNLSVSQFCRNIILIYLSKELTNANQQSDKHYKL